MVHYYTNIFPGGSQEKKRKKKCPRITQILTNKRGLKSDREREIGAGQGGRGDEMLDDAILRWILLYKESALHFILNNYCDIDRAESMRL